MTHVHCINLNSADQRATLPVVKANETRPLDTEQCPTPDARDSVANTLDETRTLLEVAIHPHWRTFTAVSIADRIGITVSCPCEALTGAEGLISPCQGCVNDVFAIAAYSNEAAGTESA